MIEILIWITIIQSNITVNPNTASTKEWYKSNFSNVVEIMVTSCKCVQNKEVLMEFGYLLTSFQHFIN